MPARWPLFILASLAVNAAACGGEPAPLFPPFRTDEPLTAHFSGRKAADYFDQAAVAWVRMRRCAACHTIVPYLMSRTLLSREKEPDTQVRRFVEEVVLGKKEAEPQLPKDAISAVVVQVAGALAINDRLTTGKLQPISRQALDRMWTFQRTDGSWEWPYRDAPPIKLDEHYGVTFAALAAGVAPDGYAETVAARKGLEGIARFLKGRPPTSLHEKGMLIWLAKYLPRLVKRDDVVTWSREILRSQRPDGGWSLADLVDNTAAVPVPLKDKALLERSNGHGKDYRLYVSRGKAYKATLASDGYATGFAVFVCRQGGIAASDVRLQRGGQWLCKNQRATGRWFTPSIGPPHSLHYISHAGTAYALMALDACGMLPGDRRP